MAESAQHDRGCRCVICRLRANAVRRARKAGRRRPVPLKVVRRHIVYLRSRGMGLDQIARLASISDRGIKNIAWKHQGTVRRGVAERVLAVPVLRAGGRYETSYRARKVLRGLLADGWTRTQIAAWVGLSRGSLRFGPRVRIATRRALEQLRDRLDE